MNKRTPQVGIFFVVDGSLLIDAVPVAQGEPYGDTVGHGGHHDYWKALTPKNAVEKRFKERAYDAYPRGRVVFFTKTKRFVVYADKCLTAGMLQRIATRLGIDKPLFTPDEHYQCAGCNPSFLD